MTKIIKENGVKVRVDRDGTRWAVINRKPDKATEKYLHSMKECSIWVWCQANTVRTLIPEAIVPKVRRLYLQAPLNSSDGQFISTMTALVYLVADPPLALNFHSLRELRELRAQWHASWVESVGASRLERLLVQGFRGADDLRALADTESLQELELVQTSIVSLSGVQRLRRLEALCISYAPKLEDITDVSKGTPKLARVEFESCSRISSYAPLAQLASLKTLKLTKCAAIPSLRLFKRLRQLDLFSFVGTPVLDNDTKVLAAFPSLSYAGFLDKRGYNSTFAAVEQTLQKRKVTRVTRN